jgi:hypothetical protein
MEASFVSLPTLEKLRVYVLERLCGFDCLDPKQTPMLESIIVRQGKPCGLFLQVQGPRLLRSHAIWVGQEDRILFYDSTGARLGETRLCEAPDVSELTPVKAAARAA